MAVRGSAEKQSGVRGAMAGVRVVESAITAVVEAVGALLVTAMVIDVAIGVFTRYVTQDPVTWSEEASRFMLIWTAFLGAALAVRKGAHFGIQMILNTFPPRVRRVVILLVAIGMAGFMFLLVRIGANLTMMADMQVSPSIGVKMSWIYAAIPVSGTLMLFYLLLDVIDLLTTGRAVLGSDSSQAEVE